MPEEKTPEQLAQEAIDAATHAGEQPQEVSVTLGTGQVYKGKDYEEVAKKIASAQEEASRYITQLKKENEKLEKEYEQPEPKRQESDGYDADHYYALLAKDSKAAGVYQSKYALADLMGVPVDQVPQQLQYIRETTQHAGDMMAISAFHAKHPEFPGGDDAAKAVLQRVDEEGVPRTTRNLEHAYYDLQREGVIKPVDASQTITSPQALPQLGGGSSGQVSNTSLESFHNLDADKMLDVINNLARQGYK